MRGVGPTAACSNWGECLGVLRKIKPERRLPPKVSAIDMQEKH